MTSQSEIHNVDSTVKFLNTGTDRFMETVQ